MSCGAARRRTGACARWRLVGVKGGPQPSVATRLTSQTALNGTVSCLRRDEDELAVAHLACRLAELGEREPARVLEIGSIRDQRDGNDDGRAKRSLHHVASRLIIVLCRSAPVLVHEQNSSRYVALL